MMLHNGKLALAYNTQFFIYILWFWAELKK